MRLNENIAVSTPRVLLVPYDAHHVLRYHEWMQDPAIREATASDQLTLDEEFENQLSWRTSHDKLTFIVCKPCAATMNGAVEEEQGGRYERESEVVYAGEADARERMVGDVNLFLTPWEDDDAEDDESTGQKKGREIGRGEKVQFCTGEVDIMIAEAADRGKGMGKAVVSAFLAFVRRNLGAILEEYGEGGSKDGSAQTNNASPPCSEMEKKRKDKKRFELKDLMVKIKADNAGSIALFGGLGFRQRGRVNYFGEIQMVLEGFGNGDAEKTGLGEVDDGYRECVYDRSRLG
ncbi:acetyltransferase domain-containing protein [Biscogniauxia marginata]|nr:acetyltransferase domain-containing protein [Biscogniauxia marginata]